MRNRSSGSGPKFYRIHFRPDAIGEALWLEPDQVVREFRDGRVVSRFSEYWAARLYKFERSTNTNEKGHDGLIRSPLWGELRVCIRSLTSSGIKFQRSANIGSGRRCTQQDLIEALSGVDYVIAIDITRFPIVTTLPTPAPRLLALVEAGELTSSGMRRSRFYSCAVEKAEAEIDWSDVTPMPTR
jgi:hypothetical protein